MRVGGVLWGRRPPKAGGGPMLRRRPAPYGAGRRPKKLYNGKWYYLGDILSAFGYLLSRVEIYL